MGFRFSRRIKVLSGVSLNLSKSGISTSLGPRGAKVTLGHGKTRANVGIPGTGLSYTSLSRSIPPRAAKESLGAFGDIVNLIWIAIFFALIVLCFKYDLWTLLF